MIDANRSTLFHAAGVLALLLAAGLTPDAASAQAPHTLAELRVAFAYHPDDPAEAIYAHLRATARDACATHGSRSLKLQAYDDACARALLSQAVTQIGRANLADLNRADSNRADVNRAGLNLADLSLAGAAPLARATR